MSDAKFPMRRLPFSASGSKTTGGRPGSRSATEIQRSIWLAAGRSGNAAQQRLQGFGDQVVLMGRGRLSDIGPADRDSTLVRVEFLLPIRFEVPFDHEPQLVILPDADADEATRQIGLEYRALASDGFSLVLLPPPGSPHCDVGFYWVAIGTLQQPPVTQKPRLMRMPMVPHPQTVLPEPVLPETETPEPPVTPASRTAG
jgi:hypothetical protein